MFIASALSESENIFIQTTAEDGFGIMGHNRSMMANRVSFFFDFKGKVPFAPWPANYNSRPAFLTEQFPRSDNASGWGGGRAGIYSWQSLYSRLDNPLEIH